MERLTTRIENYVFVSDEHKAVERLAVYEDTGLTPEQILDMDEEYTKLAKELWEYKRLEEQGRLIVLPCKMGDTVYIIGSKYRRGYFEDYINTGKFDITDLPKLGNSVFLTKEEAEKALEEMEK